MENLGPLPEGIDILKSENSGKLFVVNELLTYYQRKLCLMSNLQALNLAHHAFKEEELDEALKLLNTLWEWKQLTPSTPRDYVIRNIGERRRVGNKRLIMAKDIINFLEVEDKNLNISFITVECEKIPSPVHEKEAVSDVYVLLHRNQEDHNTLMASLYDRDELITTQGQMLVSLREELNKNFKMLADMIKDKMPAL